MDALKSDANGSTKERDRLTGERERESAKAQSLSLKLPPLIDHTMSEVREQSRREKVTRDNRQS